MGLWGRGLARIFGPGRGLCADESRKQQLTGRASQSSRQGSVVVGEGGGIEPGSMVSEDGRCHMYIAVFGNISGIQCTPNTRRIVLRSITSPARQ